MDAALELSSYILDIDPERIKAWEIKDDCMMLIRQNQLPIVEEPSPDEYDVGNCCYYVIIETAE